MLAAVEPEGAAAMWRDFLLSLSITAVLIGLVALLVVFGSLKAWHAVLAVFAGLALSDTAASGPMHQWLGDGQRLLGHVIRAIL